MRLSLMIFLSFKSQVRALENNLGIAILVSRQRIYGIRMCLQFPDWFGTPAQ